MLIKTENIITELENFRNFKLLKKIKLPKIFSNGIKIFRKQKLIKPEKLFRNFKSPKLCNQNFQNLKISTSKIDKFPKFLIATILNSQQTKIEFNTFYTC